MSTASTVETIPGSSLRVGHIIDAAPWLRLGDGWSVRAVVTHVQPSDDPEASYVSIQAVSCNGRAFSPMAMTQWGKRVEPTSEVTLLGWTDERSVFFAMLT